MVPFIADEVGNKTLRLLTEACSANGEGRSHHISSRHFSALMGLPQGFVRHSDTGLADMKG